MLQLILALSFIGMILTPAIVAAKSGKKELEPEMEEATSVATAFIANEKAPRNCFEAQTLPLHGTLGFAGR